MLKHFDSEEDAVILDCAEKTQQDGGSLTKGFVRIVPTQSQAVMPE